MAFKRVALTVTAGLSIALLSACSVDGTPTRGPVKLDTGSYQTTLGAPAGDATSENELNRLRGLRLGESIVFHDEVDPVLNRGAMPTYPVTNKSGLAGIFTDVDDEPFMKTLRYGFSVGAGAKDDGNDKGYNHAVFVFTDSAAAAAAADGLRDSLLKSGDTNPRTPTQVPGAPAEMRAVTGKTVGGTVTAGFTPVGDKVIYTWADAKDAAWTATTVRVSYEKQKALLDTMAPISDDKRIDPDGLMRAVLPTKTKSGMSGAVLGPHTAALMFNSPAKGFADQQKAGVSAVVMGGATVIKTGSEGQAKDYLAEITDRSTDPTARKAASPQDLSSAKCYTTKSTFGADSAECYLAVGRYVVEADGDDLKDAQQKVSAEYLLLKQL
ncbi:DUF7373 family lipoprotein [Gordonia phthalatica]|uniref:Lipoprotein n=1 Tax=Gordonia phthalatica TaxID=1136941 RepID=A0A0N9NGE8_9ACTN|nr:hypothetical protein [Gordonia phthalatica]ALG84804.1 hypothetical protein ACH46_10200 [Gordonia phthalatica]